MRSLLSLLLFLSLASLSLSTPLKDTNGLQEDKCSYTILVKTGTVDDAGTDATVSLKLGSKDRGSPEFSVSNLESWGGAMGSGHNYFENGDLDTFKGAGLCFPTPPCWMLLSHDNSGAKPGWYVEYVELYISGSESSFKRFDVNQWLAVDELPHQLYAERNYCGNGEDHIIKLSSDK